MFRPILLCFTFLLAAAGLTVSAAEPEVDLGERSFTIRTPRLEATFRDGMIVAVNNRITGDPHADPASAEHPVPVGMTHLNDDAAALDVLHNVWGSWPLRSAPAADRHYRPMHRPGKESRYQAERTAAGVRATWTGLTNGERLFPEETFTVEAEVDAATGQLLFRASGSSPTGGVVGLQVPLVNLHAEHRLYVPSFGGLYYDRTMDPALISLGKSPFWEAPVIAMEGPRGSLGLWVEDPEFHPHFAFLSGGGRSFSAAIEFLNLMPFENHKQARSFTWRLDAFEGGWVDAMTPYRDWYARTFAPELKIRAATAWADRIRVIIDHSDHTEDSYRQVAELFGPETVLFHNWNARAAAFDHELPDWTPREGYIDQVRRLHEQGFRAMAYVNTYCVNYESPVFRRDKIEQFGLTRKLQIGRSAKPGQTFETAKPGQLLYLDPLSPEWRRYHTDMMIRWREQTATDANYEDVAGTAGDFGNGIVAGHFAAQGGVEQFRELLRRNPTVPMASEYAPADIAFAVRWPLRYQQVWGGEKTRIWWMEHMRPVSAFLFGPLHRPWIPNINAESTFHRHLVTACSDALGGLGQCAATAPELQAEVGMTAHMRQRAELFADRQLEPHFEPGRSEPDLACTYRDSEGRLYRYFAGPNVQQLIAPDGQPLYQRITGLRELETALTLPGWPAVSDGKLFGLNPEGHYALVPGPAEPPKVRVHALPANARITRCESTPERTILTLAAVDPQGVTSGEVRLSTEANCTAVLHNNAPVTPPGDGMTYPVTLPAAFVFFHDKPAAAELGRSLSDEREEGRYISGTTGLERGGRYPIPYRTTFPIPGVKQPPRSLFLNGGSESELTLDYVTTVPKQAALQVYVRHRQDRYGNGAIARLYLNGQVAHELDFGPQDGAWDTDVHLWQIPLGHLAGQPLAITLASDAKDQNNADSLWWTAPVLITDPEQKGKFVRVTEGGEEPEGKSVR